MAQRVAVWAQPNQAELVKQIASGAGLEIACAGSPLKGQSGAVAAALEVEQLADLRSALAERVADVVLIASAGDFGADPDRPDAELVTQASARGTRLLSLEPLPPSAILLQRGAWLEPEHARPLDLVRWCPAARHSFGFRQLPDALESFGRVRSMSVESLGAATDGTLGARLVCAIELVLWMIGVPEGIDASFVGPGTSGVHAVPGETLRELSGTLTANLRFADGRSATLIASDHAGVWRRAATMVGETGSIRITDDGLEWHRADGTLQDRSRPKVDRPWGLQSHEVIAEAVSRSIDPAIAGTVVGVPAGSNGGTGPFDAVSALIVAQAALLSARTGQTESIETIRHMAGVV